MVERFFALKRADYFATNNARDSILKSKLERHWRDLHPFQPDWAPWHPAYSMDASMQGPPRYRQEVRMIDAAFVRLYLNWAREENKAQRLARRLFDEKIFERKFFARQDLEAWLERQDLRKKIYWENVERLERFLREGLEKAQAVTASRRWLEKLTAREAYLSHIFADMIADRKWQSIELGYEEMFTTTENGVVVMLPRYGRAAQVIWGDMYRNDVHQRMAKNFHWHASHRYMTTENGVIVPLPVMGKAIHWIRAEVTQAEFERLHKRDLKKLDEKRFQNKKFYTQKSEHSSLEKSRFVIKKINDYALAHKDLLAKIAKPGFEGKLADLKKAKERAEAKLLRQEARDRRLAGQLEESPDDLRSTRILATLPEKLSESLDEKLASPDPVVQRDVAEHHPRGTSGQSLSGSKDQGNGRSLLEDLERKLSKPGSGDQAQGELSKLKDLQRNLASQAASAQSLLAQHVKQTTSDSQALKLAAGSEGTRKKV